MNVNIQKLRESEGFESAKTEFSTEILSLDITFDDTPVINQNNFNYPYHDPCALQSQKTHLGLQSCNLVSYYVKTYPCLREVSVLLK